MRDHIDIGSSPCDAAARAHGEECVQVSRTEDYLDRMRVECRRFLALIRVKLGPEPEGAHLAIKSNPHDFGTYLEVVCHFDDENEEAREYAYKCESDGPKTWDDDGRREQTIKAMSKSPNPTEVLDAATKRREAALAAAITHDGFVLFLEQAKAQQAAQEEVIHART
ncbi:MAG: hypothetical protein Q7T26_03415 [Dehalococcoidia bacterium]|nr:hypothetical protein [Dehalococcoidia bacterium]